MKGEKITIENIILKKKEYPVNYISTRIKRDPDGNIIYNKHGRPDDEEIMELHLRKVYRPKFLVKHSQGKDWMKEGEVRHTFGKRQLKRAIREYTSDPKNEEDLKNQLGKNETVSKTT